MRCKFLKEGLHGRLDGGVLYGFLRGDGSCSDYSSCSLKSPHGRYPSLAKVPAFAPWGILTPSLTQIPTVDGGSYISGS